VGHASGTQAPEHSFDSSHPDLTARGPPQRGHRRCGGDQSLRAFCYRRSVRLLLVPIAFAAACSGGDNWVLDAPADLKSVLAVYPQGASYVIHASRATDPLRLFQLTEVRDGAPITILFYASELVALGLEPGLVPVPGPDDETRAIPRPDRGAFRAIADDGTCVPARRRHHHCIGERSRHPRRAQRGDRRERDHRGWGRGGRALAGGRARRRDSHDRGSGELLLVRAALRGFVVVSGGRPPDVVMMHRMARDLLEYIPGYFD